MNAWVRSQPKTLRPYFGAQAAEGLLEDMGAGPEVRGCARTRKPTDRR